MKKAETVLEKELKMEDESIAKFMELDKQNEEFRYHKFGNWLMPVVKKLTDKLSRREFVSFKNSINNTVAFYENDIEAVYKRVIEFINIVNKRVKKCV